MLAVVGLLAAGLLRFSCGFLTIHDAAPGNILVVEGWVSPQVAPEVIAEFRRGAYTDLYVTGGPIESDSPLASYRTYAELTADVFRRLNFDPAALHAVPGPEV